MNPLTKAFNFLSGRSDTKSVNSSNTQELGTHLSGFPTFGNNDVYENVYASVRPIASRFSTLLPYNVDKSGNRVDDVPATQALYRPNKQMGYTSFLDTAIVGVLTQPELNMLVWRKEGGKAIPGGKITKDNIIGYTFIGGAKTDIYGNKVWEVQRKNGEMVTYTEDEVITIVHSRNPRDLSVGYSPAQAAKRWTNIDDYIADYQAGFFNNSAVPSGMFVITAPTNKEYSDIVKNMKAYHQGAANNGGVMYSYQPIDPATNKPAQAGITWIPFNVSNKDLELGTLFDNTNQKIDSAFGVPAIVRGVDDSATYANAQVAKRNFIEGVLDPLARSFYAQLTHELNRITGGLGVAITVDVEIPTVSDELKLEAETSSINLQSIVNGVGAGFTVESIVDALKLPDHYKALVKAPEPEADEDNPQVEENGSTQEAANQDEYEANGGTVIYKGEAKSTNPKAHNCDHKELTTQQEVDYAMQLEEPARRLMQKQIDRAIETIIPELKAAKAIGDPTEEDEQQFIDDMMRIIAGILVTAGTLQWLSGRELLVDAGIADIPSDVYKLTDEATDRYRAYLKTVFDSYSKDTAERIRDVLATSREQALSRQATEQLLKNIINTDAWRITRIGVTETNRSSGMASVEAMIKIEDDSEATIEKSMLSKSGDPCLYCQNFIGVWIPVKQVMIKKGENIIANDGSIFVNSWDNNMGHDVHANGKCVPHYRVAQ